MEMNTYSNEGVKGEGDDRAPPPQPTLPEPVNMAAINSLSAAPPVNPGTHHGHATQPGVASPPYSSQQHPQQGYLPQGHPQQGYPPQGHPQQGYLPQGHPQQGYPPQGHPQQSYPPHGNPSHGHLTQSYPAQGSYPHGHTTQVQVPPQGQAPVGYAAHGYGSQSHYGQQPYGAQNASIARNQVAPASQPIFATPASGEASSTNKALPQSAQSSSTSWLVVGILSAFCCLPLGVAGAVMAYLSGEDAKKGDSASHKKKLCQAKGLIITAIVIVLVVAAVAGIVIGVLVGRSHDNTVRNDDNGVQQWTDEGIYLGCFDDSNSFFIKDLSGASINFGSDNSVKKCVKYCAERAYKYAGLQDEYECYCGNSYGFHSELSQSSCDSVCPVDGKECGSSSANSVYRTNFIGCFLDEPSARSLRGNSFTLGYYDTPETCTAYCENAGYEFAGVQNKDQCYCGNDPNRYGEASNGYCNIDCYSDSELMCGGYQGNSVYKTNYVDKTYHYIGCYKDSFLAKDLETEVHLGFDNGIKPCVDACAYRGYRYAGVQWGSECYCSQSYGLYGSVAESECDNQCYVGDGICGGFTENSVYRTYYFGCFDDNLSGFDALNKTIYLASYDVTPTNCISKCKSSGYLFAGLKYGDKCYCGQDANRHAQNSGTNCDTACSGDTTAICGGDYALSLYETGLS